MNEEETTQAKAEAMLKDLLALYDDRTRTVGDVMQFIHTEVRGLFDPTYAQRAEAMRTEPRRQHHQHCGCSVCTMKE